MAHHGTPGLSTWLDNGRIKVGIDLNAGGSISYLSLSGSSYNLVNIHDKGRYVQQSYYAGQDLDRTSEGQLPEWSPWPWNPVQAGDTYADGSPVLAWSNDGSTIYVKTSPLLWDMRQEACQCDFETWITLEGQTVRVRNKLTTFRTDSRWNVVNSLQELPAAYAIADLNRVLTYSGDRPFTGDLLMEVPQSFPQNWEATEHWAACVNGENFGFGVYNPDSTNFYGGLYGSPQGGPWDKSMCYVSPHGWEALTKTSTYWYKYFLTVGTVDQIREAVYERDPRLAARSNSEQTWGFDVDGDLSDWTPSGTVTPVSVVTGALRGTATTSNPFVVSPVMAKSAAALKKVVVRLRNHTAGSHARLCFQTSTSADWSRSMCQTVAVRPYSDFTQYTFDMSGVPGWAGTVTRLLFSPVAARGRFAIDWIRIDS